MNVQPPLEREAAGEAKGGFPQRMWQQQLLKNLLKSGVCSEEATQFHSLVT